MTPQAQGLREEFSVKACAWAEAIKRAIVNIKKCIMLKKWSGSPLRVPKKVE
jgi:hypothetical protein